MGFILYIINPQILFLHKFFFYFSFDQIKTLRNRLDINGN